MITPISTQIKIMRSYLYDNEHGMMSSTAKSLRDTISTLERLIDLRKLIEEEAVEKIGPETGDAVAEALLKLLDLPRS